jgi:hypothetical protein
LSIGALLDYMPQSSAGAFSVGEKQFLKISCQIHARYVDRPPEHICGPNDSQDHNDSGFGEIQLELRHNLWRLQFWRSRKDLVGSHM